MSDMKRLTNRNAQVAAMLADGEQLKNFYRFIAQNPHINLHDACQIVIERPNATVCFSFNEWAAMDRRVTKGRKGIAYYDNDGYKQFVFDANDTHGDNRYSRPILPMKRLLGGLDELNGTDLTQDERSDYSKIHKGVQLYLQEQDALTGNNERDKLLIEGIAYSLYAKTGFPKSAGIAMSGLPYSYIQNAEFVKDVYIRADSLTQDIEEAYSDAQNKTEEINIVNDIDEEAVSDEPTVPVEHTEVIKPIEQTEQISETPNRPLLPMYEQYMKAQNTMPNAVVLIRLGDFYEVFGEGAKAVAKELDLTLTGREVGLPERVPMCGMPFYAVDRYLDKILEFSGVLVVEPNGEAKYYLSHAETREQFGTKTKEPKPVLTENVNDEPTLFDDEQSETEDWRSELIAELEETDDEQSEDDAEFNESEESDEIDEDFDENEVEEQDEFDESDEPTESMGEQPKDKVKSTPRKEEKGIKDRKRKPKPQLSMFDLLNSQEQTAEEALIERQLKYGSGVEYGKFRIWDKYQENPSAKTFANFLKKEYGWGGHGCWGGDDEMHDAKGIKMSVRGEKGEYLVQVSLKWPEVAIRIADLIDDDNYLSEQEKKQYVAYKEEQNRLREQRLEQERRRNNFIEKILTDEPRERKERIAEAYHNAASSEEFINFIKGEYGTYTTKELDGQSIVFNDYGVFVSESGDMGDISSRYSVSWVDVEKRFVSLIESNSYIEPFPQTEQPYSDAKEDEDLDALIDARFSQPVVHELSNEDRVTALVDYMIETGTSEAEEGYKTFYIDELPETEEFIREYIADIQDEIYSSEKAIEIDIDLEKCKTIGINFYLDFCTNLSDEIIEEFYGDNTDLNGVLDQSELGGAKTRFHNNVEAIKLANMLYAENRNATDAEKKVLSRFVGWGGLSQAFDANNESWKKEYVELKDLLSAEDYEQARSSTLNAYYTPKDVICGIYAALDRFGVKGNNRILEPSMGTGNFFGFMPQEIADGSRLYGVELDNLTGRIAAKLYPQANVQIKGFEDTSFPDDKFDVVVGNVPFGGYGVADSAYNRYNFRVHDYFLAKSIDKVKPNGIVAIVTSKGTMDKLNPLARKYVAERAELLGAIRLPNTAFKQTAGTEAVADILFFRKRTERINTDTENIEWLGTGKTEEGYEINNYFINHPEMILGTLAEETGLYGGKDVTVKPDGRDLSLALSEAIKNLPQGFYLPAENQPIADEKEVDYDIKPMCYKAESGRLYMRVGDEMVEQRIPAFPKDAYQRICSMIALREELHHILDIQIKGCSDETLAEEQERLNGMYDSFVSKYDKLNSQTNVKLFSGDGDAALLFACEDIDKETKKVSKAEVFYKRTIRPYIVPTNTDDPFEALQISKNERGRVDIAYIEELTNKDYDTVLYELGDSVFRNPVKVAPNDKYSGFEIAEEYLSGNVAKKLNDAKYHAEQNAEYKRNVTALTQVQPTPLTASEISVRLGATWVDKEYFKEFYCELIGLYWWERSDVQLFYNPFDSSWRLDQKDQVRHKTQMKQKEVFGTHRAPAYRLFIDAMNMRATTIYDTIVDADGNERRVLNQPETIAAREKQNQIKELFANWIYSKPERREELETTYNRLFNQIRLPNYDGSYLKFPEMNPAIELNPHQNNAVHRIITSPGSTLLHHVVGSGKTYTMVASIMKMRQLGICKKAMVAVPNHLVQQWAGEWRKLYPNAKILVATKEDLEKDNRQRFVSKVAFGDWDGIIIAQSSFAKIPVSQERQIGNLVKEITRIEETIRAAWEENGMPRGAVKNLERIKKSRKVALKKLMDGNKKDDVLTFENLGVDYLYIDEAHYYKNLFLFTKMNNVAGVSNAASQRASDIKLKCEYLQELHGSDRGVVFGTGTPISNSMSEMYTMQNYLQPQALAASGITFFDGWAADFGETITSMELAPSGEGYRARTRFSKFTNLPELLAMYRSFADVQTAEMVKLNVPEAERHVINLKPSDTVLELARQITERAEKIHNREVSPYEDNMLKITSDGKKLALDPRCFVPESADEAGSKLNVASEYIHEIWERTSDIKGTQIVFCDLSTPKKRFEDYEYGTDFDAYNDLKYKLVQRGIPPEEIAYIHEANTDEQKQTLFDKVNSGAIRVLIGSTEKCGAGTNVQKRLVALHHLDTPYRPSDMEQREGRIIRQGNENKKVDIYTYVTERTFDSYSYQILENKQKFISQINKGDLTVREAEDIDETTLSYAEIKAITAANPKIKRKMEVDAEISRLRVLEGQYKKNICNLQNKILKDFPEDIRKQELLLERVTLDLKHLQENKPQDPEAFALSVNGTVYTDKKEGGKALTEALYKSKPETVVAEYCGFKISMQPISLLANEREITLAANGQYTLGIGESASGNLTRLENFIEDFPKRKERLENNLKQLKNDLQTAKEQVKKPFEHKERLQELMKEETELNVELNLDKPEEEIAGDENDFGDDNFMALPAQRKFKEEDTIIDKEDKTALMQVDLLPDYTVDANDMHEYGYTWDGMLPIRKRAAQRIFNNGIQVYKLGKDDTETEIERLDDFEDGALYGVEKPLWKNYTESENGRAYLAARLEVAKAASKTASKDMDYVDERFTIDFIESNFTEKAALNKYAADKSEPTAEAMQPYVSQLLDEYAARIWSDALGYYGWDEISVKRSIAENIENAELKEAAYELTRFKFDPEKELMTALGKFSEEEIKDMNLPAFDDELTVVAKERAHLLSEGSSIKKYAEGLLLFENNAKDTWYVLNDTFVLNKDGEKLDVGDKTNVMTVLAYNGLHNGNPLRKFDAEEDAHRYFEEKVKEIRAVRLSAARHDSLIVNNGTTQERILAIIEDYCDGTERMHGGTQDSIDTDLLAENAGCSEDDVKAFAVKYGASIDAGTLRLNDALQFERQVIAARPNFLDFVGELRKAYFISQRKPDYVNEVIRSVESEYDAFKADMLQQPAEEIFYNNYKIHLYNEFSEVIQYGEGYLSEKEFRALYEDKGHILGSLYDDYVGAENYSVETYSDTAQFIKDYCEDFHNETYYPTTYYGKDTENRAYFYMTQDLSVANIWRLEEMTDAEMITVAAPGCYISQDKLDKKHIFFLNIGRDISEEQLEGKEAMRNMMDAMDNYKRIYPLYLNTGAYAREHNEIIAHRNSRKSNIECKLAIEDAIRNNYDGMHLNEGIEDKIIERFGMERVAFVLATTVNEHDWDGRYSKENKEWAKTIPMSEDENVRRECYLNTHPAVLDAFINRIRGKIKENSEENKEMAQDKFKNFTARGDKVLSIIKDRDNRNIAIIQREKMGDFVVAARYDTMDGKWGAAKYDFPTLEAAEQYRTEKYGFENVEDSGKKTVKFKISPEALIKKYQFNSRFMMPKDSGYAGCAYSIFNDHIYESTFTADAESDTRERALEIRLPEDYKIDLYDGGEKVMDFRAWELAKMLDGTTADKYEREARINIYLPRDAVIKDYETSLLIAMPANSEYEGYVYYLPQSVVNEDKKSENGDLIANVGENFRIILRKGEEKKELTAKQLFDDINGKNNYKRELTAMDGHEQQDDDEKKWATVQMSENAVIANYENSTLFKMPKGEYAGFVYYIPSGMVRKEKDGLYLRIPEDFTAHLKDGEDNKDLSAQEFVAAIDGKTDADYKSVYRAPSEEAKAQFAKVEQQLRQNVPEEMRNKPNWAVLRTRRNNATGKLDKFLINAHTGDYAESDNPKTWADFDTACAYARENGGVCLAYALDGKDNIACIDLDGCMQENGDFSEIAQKTFIAASGSYAEKSISGKGLHIFGKTKGADLRSFSKDKTMEYYQGGQFIAMTGDYYGSSELKSFDTPMMQNVLESKLEKRTEWKHTGEGIEGLSSMDDREMLEKAFAAKNGDTVKRLYNGEDLRGNHSNSDMSLMNYLAFWSNHDIDQMLRVFATSGLYRAEKPQSYYEHTAIKAIKETPVYNPPKASNNKPSGNESSSGKGGK